MTQAQRNSAIKELIEQHTAANTVSKKVARDSLIREGIYTKAGNLAANYGGVHRGASKTRAD